MTCQTCDAPAPPGIYLCRADASRLEGVLEQIPDALEDADDTVAKLDRLGSGGSTLGSESESQEPLNLGVMEKRRALWETVVSKAREVLEHDDSDDLQGVEPVTYLRMSTDLIRHQDFAGEILKELEDGLRALLRAVDCRPDVISLGHCGTVHDGVPCSQVIRARKGDSEARCRTCGATFDVTAVQQERAAEAWEHFDTLANVVAALRKAKFQINPRSARRWAKEGNLRVLRYREDGVALYSPGQVIDTHQRMKARHGGKRERVA